MVRLGIDSIADFLNSASLLISGRIVRGCHNLSPRLMRVFTAHRLRSGSKSLNSHSAWIDI